MKESADGCPEFEPSDCQDGYPEIYHEYANKLLREWFEAQTVVSADIDMSSWRVRFGAVPKDDTHTARLIAVRPIERDSKDKFIKDWLQCAEAYAPKEFVDRAKKLLSGGK